MTSPRTSRTPASLRALVLAAAMIAAGCSLTPTYRVPESALNGALSQDESWHLAELTGDDEVSLIDGTQFRDPTLQKLLAQLQTDNLDIQQAEARLRAAGGVLEGAGAGRLPQVGIDLGGTRRRGSATTGTRSGSSLSFSGGNGNDGNSSNGSSLSNGSGSSGNNAIRRGVDAGARISWAPDLWGTVAAQVASGEAGLQAASANLRAAILQAQVSLIQAYWRMRLAEERLNLLQRSVATTRRSLDTTRNQYAAGMVSRSDVLQAEIRLQSIASRRHALERSRDTERHAIAVLLGKPPAALENLRYRPLAPVPSLPKKVAIDLLRRRPDVRAAEREVAAANAEIGVARGAWLPTLSFSGTYGLGADTMAELLASPLRTWSVGAQLAATLFDGGTRRGRLMQTEAAYDEKVAAYRQQVLNAVQEIEDNLLNMRTLASEATDQEELARLAEASERVVRNRYQTGMVGYLEVATAEATTIDARDQALSLRAERLASYVDLLAALGGSLPAPIPAYTAGTSRSTATGKLPALGPAKASAKTPAKSSAGTTRKSARTPAGSARKSPASVPVTAPARNPAGAPIKSAQR
ncbi:MAG: efflux transporter outer membrane subunit [Lautropia sp.]|nr:efflux transporter outer membrane subunit [Lautropia sp.]